MNGGILEEGRSVEIKRIFPLNRAMVAKSKG